MQIEPLTPPFSVVLHFFSDTLYYLRHITGYPKRLQNFVNASWN